MNRTAHIPEQVKACHRKAITRAVIEALRAEYFHTALQNIRILAYAPWPNARRIKRLVNLHVTRVERRLKEPCSGFQRDRLLMTIYEARNLPPIGWTAVEGGAR